MRETGMRRVLTFFAATVLVLASLTVPTLVSSTPASAAGASGFNPGNIISDQLFYDGNAMSAAEVQSFLNQKVPQCLIGVKYAPGSISPNGNIVANACLKDFRVSTQSKAANAHCGAYVGVPNETAAQIIAKVGKICGISPKVLLVMLEKEQSLVTDDWPVTRMYNYAMGWGCPDSGPGNTANCDESGSGFAYQVYQSAWQFKVYKANPDYSSFKRYRPFQTASIKWHPRDECGTSNVYIENWATSALYIYTPYRPNQAALDAGWGTGDSCSSYGNRNFYLFYTQWFGATQIVNHAHLDSLTGEYNGIKVTGWARKISDTGTASLRIKAFDLAGNIRLDAPFEANKPLDWFNGYFPGWGSNHGFNNVFKVEPGTYKVTVYNASQNNEVVGSGSVYVPVGQGYVDQISQTESGIRLRGWSVDFRKTAPDTIRVVLDGVTLQQTFTTTLPTTWIDGMFPGMGNNHAYDFTVPAGPGPHTVCVYGAGGLLAPCGTINLYDANLGWIDTIASADGGLRFTGWAVSRGSARPAAVDISINGKRTAINADKPLAWFDSYIPGAGPNHGFDVVVPHSSSGIYEFCLVARGSGAKIHCTTKTAYAGEGVALDTLTAAPGRIRVTGWATLFGRTQPSEVRVDIDGVGSPYLADKPLAWFNDYFAGAGSNHGYDLTIPTTPGSHEVCVYGERTRVLAGCKRVTVPGFVDEGYVDGVVAGTGSVRVYGWSRLVGDSDPSEVWVNIDGFGGPYLANKPLAWFNDYFPGSGANHGYDITIPVSPGEHEICVYGEKSATLYSCKKFVAQ